MNPENSPPVPPSPLPDAAMLPTQPPNPAVQPQVQFQPQPQVEQVSKQGRNMAPLIIVVFVLAVLGVVGYLFGPKMLTMLNIGKSASDDVVIESPGFPITEETPVPTQVMDPETQLERDIQNVNNKVNNVDIDVTNADKGLNDQPIPQGQ